MSYRFLLSIVLFCATPSVFAQNTFQLTLESYLNGEPIVVPPGNRNSAEGRAPSESQYQNVLQLISKKDNVCVIQQAGVLYDLDPILIVGSIVGEHTFNVSAWDIGQENYIYMVKRWISRFEANGINLAQMLLESEYDQCTVTTESNYDLWSCYNSVWRQDRRNDRRNRGMWELKWTFFNPMGAGYTYGFGQLGPERALMVTDLVHQVSGFDELSLDNPEQIYDAILNPQISIHYVAANNRIAINLYKQYANFDISQNPGVVATLYNLGREYQKANELFDRTLDSIGKTGTAAYPQVNYYGWFINSREVEIRNTYEAAVARHCN